MERDLDFDPRNLPPDVLQAVGLITTCCAQTEHVVEDGIAGCLKIDFEYGAAITTHMNNPLRDNVLRAVAEIKINDLDALDKLDELLDEITKALKLRNTYVHNSLCVDKETSELFTVRTDARGRVEMDVIPAIVKEIEAAAIRIYQAGTSLYRFLDHHDLLAIIPDDPRPRQHKSRAARKKRRESFLAAKTP